MARKSPNPLENRIRRLRFDRGEMTQQQLAERVGRALDERGYANASVVVGTPRDLRLALDAIAAAGGKLAAVATVADVAKWPVVETIAEDPLLADTKIIAEACDAAGAYQVGVWRGRAGSEAAPGGPNDLVVSARSSPAAGLSRAVRFSDGAGSKRC